MALCHLAAQEVLKAEDWRIAEGRVRSAILSLDQERLNGAMKQTKGNCFDFIRYWKTLVFQNIFRLSVRSSNRLLPYGPAYGNVENEALENEDRSTKHPKLENEAPKTRKRSTQNSKTEHPNLENGAPKNRKRSTEAPKTRNLSFKTRDSPLSSHQQRESSTITNRMQFKTIQVELRGGALRLNRDQVNLRCDSWNIVKYPYKRNFVTASPK